MVGSALTHAKSVSPASGTAVEVGDVLTYTLTFTNPGAVPPTSNTSDDLSDVLDDATLDAGSVTARRRARPPCVNGNQPRCDRHRPAGRDPDR